MPAEIAALTFHQLGRPAGAPTAELFALRELALPALEPGDALLENLYL
jgi:NADPH-dependent curcumin reductase CurA